jgi:hypothetical protein
MSLLGSNNLYINRMINLSDINWTNFKP